MEFPSEAKRAIQETREISHLSAVERYTMVRQLTQFVIQAAEAAGNLQRACATHDHTKSQELQALVQVQRIGHV